MDLFQPIIELYENHEKLAIALLGLVGGWLLTRFLPSFYSLSINTLSKIGRKFGGRFAYKSIQGSYLNWVVLQNQDLNLTGIIGSGQKPKLEQVFISLKIHDHSEIDDIGFELEQNETNSKLSILGIILKWIVDNVNQLIEGLRVRFVNPTENENLFKPTRFWRLRNWITREDISVPLRLITLLITFDLIPLYILVRVSSINSFIAAVGASLLGFIFVAIVYETFENYKKIDYWIFLMIFSSIPVIAIYYVWKYRVISNSESPISVIVGVIFGIAIYALLANREKIFQKKFSGATDNNLKDFGQILSQHNNVAVLGNPGSGKSTFVQFIALTFAQEKAGESKFRKNKDIKKRTVLGKWHLPILIPLRKIAQFVKNAELESDQNLFFEAFRQEILPSELRDDFTDTYLRHMLKKKRCLFLLDGLDEVANDEEFRLVVNEIKGLISQFAGNKFLLTSRHSGWRGGVGSSFLETEIQELNEKQISTFIDSWYEAIEENRSRITKNETLKEKNFRKQRAYKKANQLKEAVNNVKNIRNLAKNPLLLSMICFVHYSKTLPEERMSLYEDCGKLLLEQWEVEKGLPQDDIPLSYARKDIVMQEIAYAFHSGRIGNGTERKEARGSDIINIIRGTLEKFNMDSSTAQSLFNKLVNRTGLIIVTERYKDLHGFSHLTFQEFYTAKYLHNNQVNVFAAIRGSNYEDLQNLVSWWKEVILLFSSMQKNADHIIHELCNDDSKDLLRQKLQIAAQCYAESPEAPSKETREQLFNKLLTIRSKTKFEEGEILDPLIEKYLIEFSTNNHHFYENALCYSAKQNFSSSERNEFIGTLLKYSISSDFDIYHTATEALVDLQDYNVFSELIHDENFRGRLSQMDPKFVLALLKFLVLQQNSPEYDQLVSEVFEKAIKHYIDVITDYPISTSLLARIEDLKEIFSLVVESAFQKEHPKLRKWVTKTLADFFSSPPSYSTFHAYFDQKVIKPFAFTTYVQVYVKSIFALLLALDTELQMREHTIQLIDTVIKGKEKQQVWAIYLLQELFLEDPRSFDILFQKINDPNEKVRVEAITAIRKLQMDQESKKDTLEQLTKCIPENWSLQKRLRNKILSFIVGWGHWDDDWEGQVQIAGTLFTLSEYSIESTFQTQLKRASIGNYGDQYQWKVIIRDISQHLSKEIVCKLFSNSKEKAKRRAFRDLIASIIEFYKGLDEELSSLLVTALFEINDNDDIETIRFIRDLHPKILKSDKKHYELLRETLDTGYYWEKDAAYEILLENDLIRK